jgi:HlyD family secretion protein
MDREIAPEVRTRRTLRKGVLAAIAIAAVVFLVAATVQYLKPSVRRNEIQTARVERGTVDEVLQASGTAIPDTESVVSSPVDARVLRIGRRAGDRLKKGDEILTLDTSASHLDLERLKDQVAQKESEVAQARLKSEESVAALAAQLEQKRLDIEIYKFKAEQNHKLAQSGLVASQEDLSAAVTAKKGDIELRQLTEALARARRTGEAEIAVRETELRTLRNERDESSRQLELAMARADRDGVLTWVPSDVGALIHRGDVLARLADLSSFRVSATIADVHAARLAAGMPVRVRVDDNTELDGTVTSVEPRIDNGVARFFVALDAAGRSDAKLRNNLRVDVYAVVGRHSGVLRVHRGALLDGEHDSVFVVRGDRAVRVPVRFGLIGEENVEILGGLAQGDEVVVSNVSDYSGVRELRLK